MTLEMFLEQIDPLTDEPGATAKLRELVLQLAVTGRLARQDVGDAPASSFLEAAQIERERLVGARKIRARPVVPVDEAETPCTVPATWVWARLSDVGHELGQKTPDGPFTYIDVGGIDSAQGRVSNRVEVLDGDAAPSRARKLVARGTVIYSTVRPYLRNVAVIDRDFDPEPIASTAFGILHPFPGFNARYLFFWLRSAPFTSYVKARMKGMAYPAINDEKFYGGYVPIPPLAEQDRIVAQVDEFMALLDRLDAQQRARKAQSEELARASLARFAEEPSPATVDLLLNSSYTVSPDDLRASILALAVRGKLVPQDADDTPVSEVLAAGVELPEGYVRRRKIRKRSPISSTPDSLPELPPSWEYAQVQTLYDLNVIVDYADGNHGSLYPRKSEFGSTGVRFVTARDLKDGRVAWEGCARLDEDRARQLKKGWARSGDVLLTHNATVGRVGRVDRDAGEFLLGTSVTFYRLNEDVLDPNYFYHLLCSPLWQAQLEAIMEQTTRNQVSIQKQAFFQVAVPPLPEQARIAARADQLISLVNQLERQLDDAHATGSKLLDAALVELAD